MNIDLGNIHLDVYMHDDVDPVQTLLKSILKQGGVIMATLAEVKAQLETIKTAVAGVTSDIADLKKTIEDLKNQTSPVTQDQLDSLFTDVSGIASQLTALDSQTPPVVPPVV